MGLPWVRLESQIASNPKVLILADQKQYKALFAYCCALGYSGGHGLDGFIPTGALSFLHATTKDATALVEAGLWAKTTGGYQINGWAEFQKMSAEIEQRSAKARRAAKARWEGHDDTEQPPDFDA
jgi:hypothetical protein